MSTIRWEEAPTGVHRMFVNGTVEAALFMHTRDFLYYPGCGVSKCIEPFPRDGMTLDELKAWALAVYRMGG